MKKSFFFFKNHTPYFAQISTPAWGYHVVTNFMVPNKLAQNNFRAL